jgi:hypothetical protein
MDAGSDVALNKPPHVPLLLLATVVAVQQLLHQLFLLLSCQLLLFSGLPKR